MKKIEVIGSVGNVRESEKFLAVSLCINESKRAENGETIESKFWIDCIFSNKETKIASGDRFFLRGNFSTKIYHTADGQIKLGLTLFVDEYNCLYRKKVAEATEQNDGVTESADAPQTPPAKTPKPKSTK